MEQTITAKQIHEDFYAAEERLYVEAIGLSTSVLTSMNDKSRRLQKLGFGKAKAVKDCEQKEAKRKVSGHLIHVIEYFRTHYPQNKFITEEEVKKLCEKYGLLLGEVGNYIGDVPERNLREIENFKLKKEDWKEKEVDWMDSFGVLGNTITIEKRRTPLDEFGSFWSDSQLSDLGVSSFMQRQVKQRERERETARRQHEFDINLLRVKDYYSLPRFLQEPKEGKKERKYEQPPFKICAPKQDFNTAGYEIRDGYRLVYDPIVLQPVSKEGINGHLIVTAWGEEASDEIVVNENKN